MDHHKALPPAATGHLPAPVAQARFGPPAKPPARDHYSREINSIFRRQWWLIVACLLLGGTVAAIITRFLPRTYASSVSVLVESGDARGGAGNPLAVLEREGRASNTSTEIQLMGSRSVVAPVVDELDLHVGVETPAGPVRPAAVFPEFAAAPSATPAVYTVAPRAGGGLRVTDQTGALVAEGAQADSLAFGGLSLRAPAAPLAGALTLRVTPFAAAVEDVQERISAGQANRDASLIVLTCRATDPSEAQEICRAVSENYIALRSDMQRTEATTAVAFLEEQSENMRALLAVAEDSLESYGRRNQVVALDTRAEVEVQQLGGVRAERDQLAAERAALAGLVTRIEAEDRGTEKYRDLASFPTFIQNRGASAIVANLVELENRRSELALRRTERNVDLAALDERIADNERQLRSIAESYLRGLDARIASLDQTMTRAGGRLSVIPTQQVEVARLERQVEVLDRLYSELQTRLREAEVAEAVNLPGVNVVDAASFPLGPSSPKAAINVAIGLFLGGGFGLLLAFYREFTDKRLREPREVSQHTGLPILGLIPALERPGPILPVFGSVEGTTVGTDLIPARSREEDLLLEAFGGLSADLRFIARTLDGRRLRSVAVTSAVRGEGKTMVACNLAVSRASSGVRTLLVDADLRAGGVSRFFQLDPNAPGMCDVLVGRMEARSVWQRLHVPSQGEVWVVPAGRFTAEAAGRLGPPAVGALVGDTGTDFDLIVIDTPPLSALSDAATVASMVDAVVLVVRKGVTDREALDLTLERLHRANAHVIGVVLNDFEAPAHYSSYYGYAQSDAG